MAKICECNDGPWPDPYNFCPSCGKQLGSLCPSDATVCSHRNRRDVGDSADGMGHIIIHWCPDCGALKRTMIDWKFTDYPWEIPSGANKIDDAPR